MSKVCAPEAHDFDCSSRSLRVSGAAIEKLIDAKIRARAPSLRSTRRTAKVQRAAHQYGYAAHADQQRKGEAKR